MTSEIARGDSTALSTFTPPVERGQRIAALDAAAKHAEKIGDLEALRTATLEKLTQQADAALDYTALYPVGRPKKSTDSVEISREEWLRRLGKSDGTVQRWRKALADDVARQEKADAIVARAARLIGLDEAANFSSKTNEWYTPARYVDAVRDLYGGAIDLDPATCHQANETVQAAQIFTIEDGADALLEDWHGRAFINPPYGTVRGASLAGLFCLKAIDEHRAGRLECCVILVNSVHSQRWQAPLYEWPVCFVDHRIAYVNAEGLPNENPTFSNIFVAVGDIDLGRFHELFRPFGYVMAPVSV